MTSSTYLAAQSWLALIPMRIRRAIADRLYRLGNTIDGTRFVTIRLDPPVIARSVNAAIEREAGEPYLILGGRKFRTGDMVGEPIAVPTIIPDDGPSDVAYGRAPADSPAMTEAESEAAAHAALTRAGYQIFDETVSFPHPRGGHKTELTGEPKFSESDRDPGGSLRPLEEASVRLNGLARGGKIDVGPDWEWQAAEDPSALGENEIVDAGLPDAKVKG